MRGFGRLRLGAVTMPVGGSPPVSTAGAPSQAGAPSDRATEGSPCFNDIDCPSSECGGQVCDWTRVSATPVAEKVFYCTAAGHAPRGTDGWCTTDSDCKCRSLGAKCVGVYCTFTRPEDAP